MTGRTFEDGDMERRVQFLEKGFEKIDGKLDRVLDTLNAFRHETDLRFGAVEARFGALENRMEARFRRCRSPVRTDRRHARVQGECGGYRRGARHGPLAADDRPHDHARVWHPGRRLRNPQVRPAASVERVLLRAFLFVAIAIGGTIEKAMRPEARDADQLRPRASRAPRLRVEREGDPQVRALRLLHLDLPDLRAARRGERFSRAGAST